MNRIKQFVTNHKVQIIAILTILAVDYLPDLDPEIITAVIDLVTR